MFIQTNSDILGGDGYEDYTQDKTHNYYVVSMGGATKIRKYYFQYMREAKACAIYSVSPVGGYSGVTIKGLSNLPKGTKLNSQEDWI